MSQRDTRGWKKSVMILNNNWKLFIENQLIWEMIDTLQGSPRVERRVRPGDCWCRAFRFCCCWAGTHSFWPCFECDIVFFLFLLNFKSYNRPVPAWVYPLWWSTSAPTSAGTATTTSTNTGYASHNTESTSSTQSIQELRTGSNSSLTLCPTLTGDFYTKKSKSFMQPCPGSWGE